MKTELTMSNMTLNEIKITSRDIASLTGKRHDHVLRDIENALKEDAPNFGVIYKDSMNRKQYEYLLPKNIALGIVSGYSFELRMKIINRLEELEATNNKPISHLDTARMLVQSLEKQELLMYENKTLSHTVAILTHTNKCYTTTEIAKELNMKSANALNKLLNDDRIQYKQNGTWVLYSKYANCAFIEQKQQVLDSGKIVYDRMWTGLGREFILNRYAFESEVA